MKLLPAQISAFIRSGATRRNLKALNRYLLILAAMVTVYTVVFHILMDAEGQDHSWLAGLYWTLTVMTTLGFGDITFQEDPGRLFSIIVLLSGIVFVLILLPFAFIQFFYAPWLEARERARAPRQLPLETEGHVVLTGDDPVVFALIDQLVAYGYSYVLMVDELRRALDLHDEGIRVALGGPEDPETYRNLRTERAALVVAAVDDFTNTNVTFTVREVTERVPIAALARAEESVDILQLAGADHVLRLATMLGRQLSRRTYGGRTRASIVGEFGGLAIAEAPARGSAIVGTRLGDSGIRERTGVLVIGMWERGSFSSPGPETPIGEDTILLLGGSEPQIEEFNQWLLPGGHTESPVVILGGGRVGRAVARSLDERGIDWRIVEQNPAMVRDESRYVVGTAADLGTLERAGIREAPTVLVTTHDDATNIYLTIYCRRLRPDIHILSRSTYDHNVTTLYRAGADFVLSYSSMGAKAIYNLIRREDVLMLAEGLDAFRVHVPKELAGRRLRDSRIRERTGCSVVGVEVQGEVWANPDPDEPLPTQGELILVGTTEQERRVMDQLGP